jgi:protein-S-isoprenylcysteine O-methyltransferase Ste14
VASWKGRHVPHFTQEAADMKLLTCTGLRPQTGFRTETRLVAVATLKRRFTVKVSIIEKHEIVDTGIYGVIRHPAYLGHLVSLLGIGLILGNWVGLSALVVLPLAGILYRIHVEERALLRYFGPAYQAYINRTKRLLPGIW